MMKTEDIAALKKGLIELMRVATAHADCAEEFDDQKSAKVMRDEANKLYIAAKAIEKLEGWKAI